MSDVSPFELDGLVAPTPPELSGDADVFKPALEGFDWGAYESRQAELDQALANGGKNLGRLISRFHQTDPEAGIRVNSIHNTVLTGEIPEGLSASMAVLTRTALNTGLRRADLSAAVGEEAVCEGQDLRGVNFTDAVFPLTNFRGAELRGARFLNAIVNGADFTDADLSATDFTGAYLIGVKGLTPEQIAGMNLRSARTIIQPSEGESLSDLEVLLSGRLGDMPDLEKIRKLLDPSPVSVNQNASGQLMSGRLLKGLYAEGLVINDTELTKADLTGSTFKDLIANRAVLREARLSGAVILGANMQDVDMVGAWAPGTVFEDVDMQRVNFSGSNLVGAVFKAVDLRSAKGLGDANTLGVVIDKDCRLPAGFEYNGVALVSTDKPKELEQ